MQLRYALTGLLLSPILIGVVSAQSTKPAFEVASIKRNTTGEPGRGGDGAITGSRPGGVFIAKNATLEMLIQSAYATSRGRRYIPERIVGGPSWVRTLRFDVQGKAGGEVTPDQRAQMVRALLKDRFGLVVGEKQIETDAYLLRPARTDRRPGPQLIRRTASECASRAPTALDAALGRLRAGPDGTPAPPATAVQPSANPFPPFAPAPRPRGANSTMSGCTTIASIARTLSQILKRDVDDQTGMEGQWDFTLFYASVSGGRGTDVDVPDIFGAVQEQLGLKLERTRGPADVLIIDAAHEPTQN